MVPLPPEGKAEEEHLRQKEGPAFTWLSGGTRRPRIAGATRWRIVAILLVVSLLPLALVGIGAWVVFGNLLIERSLELQRAVVQSHAAAIDRYLQERLRVLEAIARTNTLEAMAREEGLRRLLAILNTSFPDAFIDIGVIDRQGRHLAYVGPYDLIGRNYRRTEWFRVVMAEGSYVSDVFSGFRRIPHCVIAVKRQEGEEEWILRATIDSQSFNMIVRTGKIGRTGDAFIVNAAGKYQTPPRSGRILDRSPINALLPHQGVRERRVELKGKAMIQSDAWLNENRWMLVVQQYEDEIMAPVNQAASWGAVFVLAAVGLVVGTTFLATWDLTSRIDRANRQRDELYRDLLRSAKLASLGELATGLAHEINNPLAIISSEQTNIADQIADLDIDVSLRDGLLKSVDRCQRQVKRCGGITGKMLQFGRKSEERLRLTDIGPLLKETVRLLEQQARVRNIDLCLDLEPGLPRLYLDGNELEQVLVNLINNAMYAIRKGGAISVAARRSDGEVLLKVEDSGCGIPARDIDRVFQPFFTTKPLGHGTGLGLSVCFGIVRGWGGTMEVRSEEGRGTTMTVRLPVPPGPPISRVDSPDFSLSKSISSAIR